METIKQPKVNKQKFSDGGIKFDNQSEFNQSYINDLRDVIKTNTSIPTHTPKKFIDCIYLYWDGTTTYELYIYINNTWKKVALS